MEQDASKTPVKVPAESDFAVLNQCDLAKIARKSLIDPKRTGERLEITRRDLWRWAVRRESIENVQARDNGVHVPRVNVLEYFMRSCRWSLNGRTGSEENRSVTKPSFQTR